MRINTNGRKFRAVFFIFLLSVLLPLSTKSELIELAGHSVDVELVLAPGAFVPHELGLTTKPTRVRAGDTIHALLRANGVNPDMEAFALVYELNPSLSSLDDLEPEILLILPRVDDKASQERRFAPVGVVVDPVLKRTFARQVDTLKAIVPLSTSMVPNAQDLASNADAGVRNIVETLEFIRLGLLRRNIRPISREVLTQLSDEAELLLSVLERSVNKPLSAGDREIVTAIEKDIEIKKGAFTAIASGKSPDRWPLAKVIVQTLKAGKRFDNLRIYYVPEALKRKPEATRSFAKLSSPSEQLLPEADYIFWGARDPSTSPVTNELLQPIRVPGQAQGITIDLSVLR